MSSLERLQGKIWTKAFFSLLIQKSSGDDQKCFDLPREN
jgi:hypothetical protein